MADIRQSGSYKQLAKPKAKVSWRTKLADKWRQTWYFERLLVVLLLIAVPLMISYFYDSVVVGAALKAEAIKIATILRQMKDEAHELDTFATLEGKPSEHGRSSYDIIFDSAERGTRHIALPPGVSMAGSVRFDAQGVPKQPVILRLRHGLKQAVVVVGAQGNINVP